MSGWSGTCPSCGAAIVFTLGKSLLKVCEHCGSAVAREGARLADWGKVASLMPSASPLQLGLEGRTAGHGGFRIAGRLQLDWGKGTWEEWLLAFEDGTSGWLAEAQGRFYLTLPIEVETALPAHAQLQPGQSIGLGAAGLFQITEVRSARFAAAEGELPFAVRPGTALNYADLAGPGGRFATLDYAAGQQVEAVYAGKEVTLDELGIRGLPAAPERLRATRARALKCPSCGGPLELRAPDETRRVGCPWCGSLLDATRDLEVLHVLSEKFEPAIPLGTKGRLAGVVWTVIGYLERSVTVEGDLYAWREYLLYEPRRGFRWLVEYDGHWSFVEPVHAGDVQGAGKRGGVEAVACQGRRYRHFQSAVARVERVLGEMYWEVEVGQTVRVRDFVEPPYLLSEERDAQEVTWSLGTYKDPEEIWKAFGRPGRPPRPRGVYANQPNPHDERVAALVPRALVFALLVGMLYLGFGGLGGRVVHRQTFPLPAALDAAAAESSFYSEPFTVAGRGNLRIAVTSPVHNNWLYLDGALINEQSGEFRAFDAEVGYWTGSDWSEGSKRTVRWLGRVPAGRWVLRFGPSFEAGKSPGSFDVEVRRGVPRPLHLVLALVLLAAAPLWALLRRASFEQRRWAESDHPPGDD